MSAPRQPESRSEPAPQRRRGWWRLRERIRRNRPLDLTWRAGVFIVGSAILAAGLVMFVTPGPGWAAVFVGLAVLATEFVWAERLLDWAKHQAGRAKDRALDPRVRRRNKWLAAVLLVLSAAGGAWYLSRYGLSSPF